jgi:cell division protein ZapA (FtsZ GTPase activity inhibitor)
MSLLGIKINGKEYKVECKDGEETLLQSAVDLINEKIDKSNDLKKIQVSNMFMIIALTLASEIQRYKDKIIVSEDGLDQINDELDKLKNIIDDE